MKFHLSTFGWYFDISSGNLRALAKRCNILGKKGLNRKKKIKKSLNVWLGNQIWAITADEHDSS